jgi:low affinity Fe/Cu permease
MMVLIQHTQNRDTQTVHLKLDELIRGVQGAHNSLIDVENLSDQGGCCND